MSWGTGPKEDHTFAGSKGCGKILHFGGKCIHPLWGNPNSPAGTPIVTYKGCTEDRLQFCWTNEGDLKHLTSGLCIQVNIVFFAFSPQDFVFFDIHRLKM